MQTSTSLFLDQGQLAQSSVYTVSGLVDTGTATCTFGTINLNYVNTNSNQITVKNGDRLSLRTPASESSAYTDYNYLSINGEAKLLHIVSTKSDPIKVTTRYLQDKAYEDVRTYPTGFPFRSKTDTDRVLINLTPVSLFQLGATSNNTVVAIPRTNSNKVDFVSSVDYKLRSSVDVARPIDVIYANNYHWVSANGSNQVLAFNPNGSIHKSFSIKYPRSMYLQGNQLYVTGETELIAIDTIAYTKISLELPKFNKLVIHNNSIYTTKLGSRSVSKINLDTMEVETIELLGYPTTLFIFNNSVHATVSSVSSIINLDRPEELLLTQSWTPFSAISKDDKLYVSDLMSRFIYVYNTEYVLIDAIQVENYPVKSYVYNNNLILLDVHRNFPNPESVNDQTPQPFKFVEYVKVSRDTLIKSNEVKVDGVNSPVDLSIPPHIDAHLTVNGINVGTRSTLVFGDTFSVSLRSSSSEESTKVRVALGTKFSEFILPIPTIRKRPKNLNFDAITEATVDTIYQSNEVIIDGLEASSVQCSVNLGSILKNGINVGSSTFISNGDRLRIELRSPKLPGTGLISVFKCDTLETYFSLTNISQPIGLVLPEYEFVGPYGVDLPYNEIIIPGELPEDPDTIIQEPIYPESTNNYLTTYNYYSDNIVGSYLIDDNTGKYGNDEFTVGLVRPKYANSTIIYDPHHVVNINTAKITVVEEFFNQIGFRILSSDFLEFNPISEVKNLEFRVLFESLDSEIQILTSDELVITINSSILKVNNINYNFEFISNKEYHLAIDLNGIYVNGTQLLEEFELLSLTKLKFISNLSYYLTEIRVSSVSRFSENFSPPSTPYGDIQKKGIITDYYNSKLHVIDLDTCAILNTLVFEEESFIYDADLFDNKIAVSFTGLNLVKLFDSSSLNFLDEYEIDSPRGLKFDDTGALYVASSDNSVIKIFEELFETITVSTGPLEIFKDSLNRIWVSHYGSNSVIVLGDTPVELVVGKSPWSFAEGDRYVYVSISSENKICAIDKITLSIVSYRSVNSLPYYLSTLITGELVIGYFGTSLVDIYDYTLNRKLVSKVIKDAPVTGLLTHENRISVVTMYHNIPNRLDTAPPVYLFSDKVFNNLPRTFTSEVSGTVNSTVEIDVTIPSSELITLTRNGVPVTDKLYSTDEYNLKISSIENDFEGSVIVPVLSNGNLQTVTNNVTMRRTPDQMFFNPILSAIKNVSYDSNEVIVSGIKSGYTGTISIDGAQIVVNNIAYDNEAIIKNGDVVKLRAYALGIYGTVKRYTIIAGEMITYFDLSLVEVGSPIQDYSWTKYYNQLLGNHRQWKYSAHKLARGTGIKFGFKAYKLSESLPKVRTKVSTYSEGSSPEKFEFGQIVIPEQFAEFRTYQDTITDPNTPITVSKISTEALLDSYTSNRNRVTIENQIQYEQSVKSNNIDNQIEYINIITNSNSAERVYVNRQIRSNKIYIDMTIDDPNTRYNFEPRPQGSKLELIPGYVPNNNNYKQIEDTEFINTTIDHRLSHSRNFKLQSPTIINDTKQNLSPVVEVINRFFTDVFPNQVKSQNIILLSELTPVVSNSSTKHQFSVNHKFVSQTSRSYSLELGAHKVITKLQTVVPRGDQVLTNFDKRVTSLNPHIEYVDKDRFSTGFTCEDVGAFSTIEEAMSKCIAQGLKDCNTFTVTNTSCHMWYSPTFYGKLSVPTAWYMGGG